MDNAAKSFALKTARSAIDAWVREGKRFRPKAAPVEFMEKRGCFVTITEGCELRGCIGFPWPDVPLIKALVDAAISACNDPRFNPIEEEELGKVRVEVSILSMPEPIRPDEVDVGRDGLIFRRGQSSGLLLPQVATEYGWNREEFLRQVCIKAGLEPGAWKKGGELLAFQAEVFSEAIRRGNDAIRKS